MGDDITRTGTVMLGFMFVFALIFGGLSLRDLNSSWNHSVETREKLADKEYTFIGAIPVEANEPLCVVDVGED